MGKLVEELVERECGDLENPWLTPAGLELQRRALEEVSVDSELGVYDDD
jgi:hypothetical protein